MGPALALAGCALFAQAKPEDLPPTRFRGAVEAAAHSFPSGTPGGSQDLFARFTPLIGFDGGDDFGFELGASLSLRVFDDPPEQRESDYGKLIRRADWDQPSDFGQLLRELRLGREGASFSLRAGPALSYTLGHGHLLNRYSNRENPDYHPASASAELVLGPTRTEVFASDILGARLFAAELTADLGRILSGDEQRFDRYHASFSIAHDIGQAGYQAPPATLIHLDVDAALHRGEQAQVFAFLGLGSRLLVEAADLGAVAGLSASGRPGTLGLEGKLELRKQAGLFRQGLFGPSYELSRFAGLGFSGEPLARERLADSFSGYAELSVSSGPLEMGPERAGRLFLSLAAEYFASGRTDGDLELSLRALEGRATGTVRLSGVGMGVWPRYSASAEARYRFAPALYAVAAGGTVFFPQPEDSTLVRGIFASLGVGADFER
ncbi:MAG: hypothetical protein HYZ28_19455 [Myxococcales bacterium]|nr:hypothetical protein [Myxococcales bacterium]